MALYSCYILGEDGHIRAREIMDCRSDDQALDSAREFLGAHPEIPAVEIWLEERRIKRLAQAALD